MDGIGVPGPWRDQHRSGPRGEQDVKDLVHGCFTWSVTGPATLSRAHPRPGRYQRKRLEEVAREPAHALKLRRALGRYLTVCHERARWSQRRLADETHYHRTAISHLEAGRHSAPRDCWLIREPEPLVSGLAGGRISVTLADQLPMMITTLRTMDDAAGGGTVLPPAQRAFDWVAGLLDQASYDEHTGRRLYGALAELGQLAGWVAHDAGQPGLGQRYHIAALHAAHSADDQLLGAHILGCMADQAARRGRAAEAVTLIESAMVGIHGRATPRLHGRCR